MDDLIAILSGPASSARVEVLSTGDSVAGEVHLLAGGVSEALVDGKSLDDALDRLRAVTHARFRVEQRLPNPANGDLGTAGPESGTLEGRPLAQLMRYCEDYVITCTIEVWRGNETARVEYKRGEISGVTVGGIDAPERLAEVMQWSSGNYRLVVPPIKLPAVAPKRAPVAVAVAPVPAPAPSAQAARHTSATKTMFGIPLSEVAKMRAAAEAAAAAKGTSTAATIFGVPAPAPVQAPAATAPVLAATPPASTDRAASPGVAPNPVPPPVSSVQRPAAAKTIFGIPSPSAPGGYASPEMETDTQAGRVSETEKAAAARAENDRKVGARKVSVPPPAVVPPPAAAPPPVIAAPLAVTRAETTEPVRRGAAAPAHADRAGAPKREAPIWTYVFVGFFFGLVLLGVYHVVGLLAH